MRVVYLTVCLGVALCAAAPQGAVPAAEASTPIAIVAQSEEFEPNGAYKFSFETGNGIKVEEASFVKTVPFRRTAENADLKDAPANEEIHVQQGSYSYIAPDGSTISLKYIADENGFQPVGDHLPTSPPIPEAIQRSIAAASEVEAIPQASSIDVQKELVPDVDIITK